MANLNDIDKRADLEILGLLSAAMIKYQLAKKKVPKSLQKKLDSAIEKAKRYVPKGHKLVVTFTGMVDDEDIDKNQIIPHVNIVTEDTYPKDVLDKYSDDYLDDDEDEDDEDND